MMFEAFVAEVQAWFLSGCAKVWAFGAGTLIQLVSPAKLPPCAWAVWLLATRWR